MSSYWDIYEEKLTKAQESSPPEVFKKEEESPKKKEPQRQRKKKKKQKPPPEKDPSPSLPISKKKLPTPSKKQIPPLQDICSEEQIDELLKIKKLRLDNKPDKKEELPFPMTLIENPTSKTERELRQFIQLFASEESDLTEEFFFRGTATAYANQSDSKKAQDIANDFVQKIQSKTKKGTDVQNDLQSKETVKKILKHTSLDKFSGCAYKDDEESWELSEEILENGLLERENILFTALMKGEAYLDKKLKRDPKNLRTPPDIPILPPSYFIDFQRPARGLPFGERQCVKKEKCYAFLRSTKPNEANVLRSKSAWIAREFLLPAELDMLKKDSSFISKIPNKRCIYCNRKWTEKRYNRYKNAPRSIALDVSNTEPCYYYKTKEDAPEEGIFILQDHIVKIQDTSVNNNNAILWEEEDAYPLNSGIIMPDPTNGIIGPFKKLAIEDLQAGYIEMILDMNGSTKGEVPTLRECNFF